MEYFRKEINLITEQIWIKKTRGNSVYQAAFIQSTIITWAETLTNGKLEPMKEFKEPSNSLYEDIMPQCVSVMQIN